MQVLEKADESRSAVDDKPSKAVAFKGKIASSPMRLLAFCTDIIFLALICRLAFLPFFLPENWERLQTAEILPHMIPAYLIGLAVLPIRDWYKGAGFGKWMLNMRVARLDEALSLPRLNDLVKRNIFLLLLPVEAFLLAFDKHCRRLGDKSAGTVVIETQKIESFRFMTVRVIGFFAAFSMLWLAYVFTSPMQVQKTMFYKNGTEFLRQTLAADQHANSDIELEGVNRDGSIVLLTFRVKPAQSAEDLRYEVQMQDHQNGYSLIAVKQQ